MSTTPPGWYPQADGSQRYWSGSAWTEHTAPAPAVSGEIVPVRAPMAAPPPSMPFGRPGGANPPVAVAAKSPGLALLASFFLPGLGQLVNGQVGTGILFLVAYLVSLGLLVVLIGFVLVPLVWVVAMVDAYQGAQRWNAQRGIVS